MDFDPGIELFWTISITVSSILGTVLCLQYCLTPRSNRTPARQGFRSPSTRSPTTRGELTSRSIFSHGRKQRHYFRKFGRRLRRTRNQALGFKGAILRSCCCSTGRWNPPANALEGEIALVTGSASGIGVEIAYQLAAQKCSLVLVDIDTEGLREVADELTSEYPDVDVWMAHLDVSDGSAVVALAGEIEDKIGSDRYVSILVNNAGIVIGKTVEEMTTDEYDRTMAINTHGPFYLTKTFLPSMIEGEHGHIVGVSSLMGSLGSRQLADYCASKAAHTNFMNSLRLEMKSEGLQSYIRTLTVMPALVSTGMFAGAYSYDTDTALRRLLFPALSPKSVAQYIVDGIIYDREIVMLPSLAGMVFPFLQLLPVGWADSIVGYFGGYSAMLGFEGKPNPVSDPRKALKFSDYQAKGDTSDEEEDLQVTKSPSSISIRSHKLYNVSAEGPVTDSLTSRGRLSGGRYSSSRKRSRSVGLKKRSAH